jgi:hypothetical protein
MRFVRLVSFQLNSIALPLYYNIVYMPVQLDFALFYLSLPVLLSLRIYKKVSYRKTYIGYRLPFPDQYFINEDLLQLESCLPDGINPYTDLRRSSQVIFGSSYVRGDCPTCENRAWA